MVLVEKEGTENKRSSLIGKSLKINYKGKTYVGKVNSYVPNTMGKFLLTFFVPSLSRELLLSKVGNKFIVLGLYNPLYY